ncbi:PHD finger family protein [Hibiscus syriacus]|uniref:PHD finger family protein n=1 Tax=Hibiscus syriacus TaxID=106335 RepID=A0A6A3BVL3_HIBSY|nr:PHD finger family protein [Hibiscus syriacus]
MLLLAMWGGKDLEPRTSDLAENDGVSGKRVRSSPSVSEESTKELSRNTSVSQGDVSSIQSTKRKVDVDTGPVQQLVAMFGTLVAQGEKAVGSLGILISSISADLLAEVVMANMRNLPPTHPHTDADDELLEDMCMVGSDTQAKYPPSFLVDVVSLSSTFPPIASLLNSQQPVPTEIVKTEGDEEDDAMAGPNGSVAYAGMAHEAENALLLGVENIDVLTPPDIHDVGNVESDLPGLVSSFHDDGLSDAQAAISLVSTDLEDASQEQGTSFGGKSPLHVLPSISVERSEELSPKTTVNDSGSVVSSTATSVVSSRSVVLPKTSAPLVNLSDDQKDDAQTLAYIRIIEAYKQISVAGGSQVRSSLLAYLGVELPSELDLQRLLREHILLDYINHEGHELTLRVLYRLFGEAEAESDFFSCTTAASAYETFLLASAVHHLEEVRMKAIRLVANKLYPLPYISQQIEDFAKEMLLSAVNVDAAERTDAEGLITESYKDSELEKPLNEHQSMSITGKDISADVNQSETSQSGSSPVSEAQWCMSLYFSVCTKKHSLFGQIFIIYVSASKAVKQAIHRQIPILVRTMGLSSDLLEIISDPPSGSENLLVQVLQTLTEGKVLSPEMIFTIKKLFDSKLKDIEILVPVLPFLPGDEVFLHSLNNFLSFCTDHDNFVLKNGSSHSGPVLAPAEVLIAIHGIDPESDGIPLKKVIDACNACFEQRNIFTQQVLAEVLNQLVGQIRLPLLFMRTVLQAIGAFPALVEFIIEILSRLVSKKIWKNPKLWVGFLKCALLTQSHSFSVLLQLPPPQLENALNRTAALKAPLVAHASQPNIRTSLPRSILAVLGLAMESQSSSQAQTSQAHTGETSNSEKDAVAEKSKE